MHSVDETGVRWQVFPLREAPFLDMWPRQRHRQGKGERERHRQVGCSVQYRQNAVSMRQVCGGRCDRRRTRPYATGVRWQGGCGVDETGVGWQVFLLRAAPFLDMWPFSCLRMRERESVTERKRE